ncbi:hypothetical protein EKH79_09215 [Dyella dinghuensis]|uniref:Abortive phage infection protein C-terminal domain-containing protein n=1 Tax=Dyella dinghuensis TaxID=1920169 RepID=A0A3S0S3U1_9GAMM|nr:AIPR family protein [Dyella dinghuensis]RUL64219.1 hypothetical protein EKH79_09215 [Dyella dinghuensis]
MAKYIQSDAKDFAALSQFVTPYEAQGRTASAALLIWFLEVLFRLDETEAQDAVCDKKHDAGVDAIVVSDSSKEITVFQAKRKEKIPGTLGDTDLKSFVGALAQFKSRSSVLKLIATTKNDELKKLLEEGDVADKIGNGYKIRPIFVCNVAANVDASDYLAQAEAAGHLIELWDLKRLGPLLKQLSKDWFLDEEVKLKVDADHLFYFGAKTSPKLVYTAIRAQELVSLPGIDDSRIFAQNVRLGLGRTRVNKDIIQSVVDKGEHENFLTFHNGLTVVAKDIKVRGSTITLSGLSVCNGCQSLLSFYENRKALTPKLEVLVRIVKVGSDRKLPEVIAYRTNNQNAISLRDLNSNDSAQLRLKNEFDSLYGAYSEYTIKRGEVVATAELKNEDAGRMILALYLGEPTSAHQKYRIFGDLEARIFSIDMNASRVRFAQLLTTEIYSLRSKIKEERIGKYGLTIFILLYLVGCILKESAAGNEFLKNPSPFLLSSQNAKAPQRRLLESLKAIIDHAIVELNYYVKEHGGDSYNYKSEFKSLKAVEALRNAVVKAYEKDIHNGRAQQFALPQ